MKTVTTTTPIPKKRKLFKRIFMLIILLIMIAGLGVGGAFLWYQDSINVPPSTNEEPKQTVMVAEGQSLIDILPELKTQNLIKNVEAFRIHLRLENKTVSLKKGKYLIPSNLNVPQLLSLLSEGPVKASVSVRLREGLRMDEISAKLNETFTGVEGKLFNQIDFDNLLNNPDSVQFSTKVQAYLDAVKPKGKSLEGFLHPDTYNIGSDATAKDVVELLISTQLRRLEENKLDYTTTKGRLKNFYEVLTLATIVELEARTTEDRKLVADLFIRRLATGQVLGSDITLLYKFKDWNHPITNREIQDTSNLYNTRSLGGLTPTPICSPSLISINAVLNPTANNFVYFLHDKDGITRFARTYNEHLANVRKYL